MKYLLTILCIIISLVRIIYIPENTLLFNSYKAFAHIFVGYLLGGYCFKKEQFYIIAAICISIVEILCAIYSHI